LKKCLKRIGPQREDYPKLWDQLVFEAWVLYRRTNQQEARMLVNHHTDELVDDLQLRQTTLTDIISPYSWVDFEQLCNQLVLQQDITVRDRPLSRIVGLYDDMVALNEERERQRKQQR
jgi:hypothetical protein